MCVLGLVWCGRLPTWLDCGLISQYCSDPAAQPIFQWSGPGSVPGFHCVLSHNVLQCLGQQTSRAGGGWLAHSGQTNIASFKWLLYETRVMLPSEIDFSAPGRGPAHPGVRFCWGGLRRCRVYLHVCPALQPYWEIVKNGPNWTVMCARLRSTQIVSAPHTTPEFAGRLELLLAAAAAAQFETLRCGTVQGGPEPQLRSFSKHEGFLLSGVALRCGEAARRPAQQLIRHGRGGSAGTRPKL